MKTLVLIFVLAFSTTGFGYPGEEVVTKTTQCESDPATYAQGINQCIVSGIADNCLCNNIENAKGNLQLGKAPVTSNQDNEKKEDDESENPISGTASFDGRFRCEDGQYTQDYTACKSAVTAYNAAMVAEKALVAKHQMQQKNLAAQLTQQAQMDAQTGNIQGQAFNYEIAKLEKLRSFEREKVYFYGAQMATIGGITKAKWPNEKMVSAKCVYGSGATGDNSKLNQEAFAELESSGGELSGLATACGHVINVYKDEIFKNKHNLQGILMYEAELLQKSIAHQQKARQYSNQIAQLQGFKENAFAQDGTVTPQGYAAFCQTNPGDARCQLAAGRPDLATFGQGGLNFQGGAGGQLSFGDENGNPLGGDTNSNQELAEGLENILGGPGEPDSGSSKPIDAPRAAKAGDPAAGGAGGGALGGGGGGAPAAPGITPESEAGTEPKEEKKDLKVADYNPYSGKKRGIRIFSGGSQKKKDSKNPFRDALGKLGKKKKNRAVASMDTLPKDIDLFKKISGRYAQLSKDKLIAPPESKSGKSK